MPQPIAPKSDWAACATDFQARLIAALQTTKNQVVECTVDCAEELVGLEQELEASFKNAIAAIKEQAAAIEACGDDSECRIAAVKEIVGIVLTNVNDNTAIVKKHLAELEGKFPEAAQCAGQAFVALGEESKAAALEFVGCIKA